MVTLAQAVRSDAPEKPSAPRTAQPGSLLRMGVPARLAVAAGAMLLLWSAIALGLA